MTDNTQPEALRLADDLEASSHFPGNMRSCNNAAAAELRRQHARIAELEAELEAIKVRSYAYNSGWKDGYKQGAWAAQQPSPTPPAEQQAAPKAAPAERVGTIALIGNGSTTLTAAIAPVLAAPQQKAQEPALFVSAKQLADLVDPSHATGGSYLPARKTRAGLFTQPLYTAPQPAPAPLIARSLAEWHEQDGNVAWWVWDGREWAGEPAWIGTPNCEDWPGYHTHWTPHPEQPVFAALASQGGKV